MVKSLLVVHPLDYMAAGGLQLATTAQHGERVRHTASLGKNQNSKLELQFLLNVYHFRTMVKLKNFKANHHKLEDICIVHRHTLFYCVLYGCTSQDMFLIEDLWQH